MTATRRAGPPPADWLLSAALAAVAIVGTAGAHANEPEARDPDWLAAVLLLAGPALLLLRRARPVPVLGAVAAVTLVYLVADFARGPVFLALLFAVAWAIVHGHRIAGWTVLALSWAGIPLARMIPGNPAPDAEQLLFSGAWLIVIGTVSEIVRVRRERTAEAAHAAEELRRRRASDERLRMAQELHDVLAHNLSLISVQAGVALHLLDDRPEHARPALTAIRDASGDALGQLRRVLDMLRGDADAAPRQPAPTFADLVPLVDRTAAAGLDVHLDLRGEIDEVPGDVQRAAFRIVQESLTNAARYAGGAQVRVVVDAGRDHVAVQVDDDGAGVIAAAAGAAGAGNGIVGMRERAAALGGTLDAGPRAGGGFRVRAWLPVGETS